MRDPQDQDLCLWRAAPYGRWIGSGPGGDAGEVREAAMATTKTWTVQVMIEEEGDRTRADAVLRTGLTIDLPPVHTRCVTAADPAAALLTALQAEPFDAVVLVARPRSVWGRLFHRSVTAQLLRHSPVPVLVLPAVEP